MIPSSHLGWFRSANAAQLAEYTKLKVAQAPHTYNALMGMPCHRCSVGNMRTMRMTLRAAPSASIRKICCTVINHGPPFVADRFNQAAYIIRSTRSDQPAKRFNRHIRCPVPPRKQMMFNRALGVLTTIALAQSKRVFYSEKRSVELGSSPSGASSHGQSVSHCPHSSSR